MPDYGNNAFSLSFPPASGRPAGIISGNPANIRHKIGGVTLDWTTVLAAVADATDALTGDITKTGQKSMRFGTVLCRISAVSNGTVVGKLAPYSAPLPTEAINGALAIGGTTATLTNLAADGVLNAGDWLHLAAGAAGTAEDIQVKSFNSGTQVVTFNTPLLHVHGDTAAVTKPDDGRQTLRRGECWLLPHTVILGQTLSDIHPGGVFEGGCSVYLERVARDYGTHGVPSNPTRAILEAGFPGISWDIS